MKTSCGTFLNLAHYFPYDAKLRLLAHSRSFLANKKARNAIVGAENLLMIKYPTKMLSFLDTRRCMNRNQHCIGGGEGETKSMFIFKQFGQANNLVEDLNVTITENEKVMSKRNMCTCSFAIAVMLQYYLANWPWVEQLH